MSLITKIFGAGAGYGKRAGKGIANLLSGGVDSSVNKATNVSNYRRHYKIDASDDLGDAGKHLDYWSDKTGGVLTPEALTSIHHNVGAGLAPGEGASAAGMIRGGMFTNAFNPVDKGLSGGLGAALMGGGIGALAAGATDGRVEQGAVIGAIAGVGIRNIGQGFAKGLMGDMPSLERKFVDDLLGGKPIQETVELEGKTVQDLIDTGYGNKTLAELDPEHAAFYKKIGDPVDPDSSNSMSLTQYAQSPGSKDFGFNKHTIKEAIASEQRLWQPGLAEYRTPNNPSNTLMGAEGDFKNLTLDQVKFIDDDYIAKTEARTLAPATRDLANPTRRQQLDAIRNLGDDPKNQGFWDKRKRNILMGESAPNIGQQTRVAGLLGSALTGMAFSSKHRDHRRGFNKKRGNRV